MLHTQLLRAPHNPRAHKETTLLMRREVSAAIILWPAARTHAHLTFHLMRTANKQTEGRSPVSSQNPLCYAWPGASVCECESGATDAMMMPLLGFFYLSLWTPTCALPWPSHRHNCLLLRLVSCERGMNSRGRLKIHSWPSFLVWNSSKKFFFQTGLDTGFITTGFSRKPKVFYLKHAGFFQNTGFFKCPQI